MVTLPLKLEYQYGVSTLINNKAKEYIKVVLGEIEDIIYLRAQEDS